MRVNYGDQAKAQRVESSAGIEEVVLYIVVVFTSDGKIDPGIE